MDCGDERNESPLWLRIGNVFVSHNAKAAIAQTPSPQSKTWGVLISPVAHIRLIS